MLENFLGRRRTPKLPEEERLSCEGRITIKECVKALDTFENEIEDDGIPTEFYITFWSCVGELMTDFFNFSFDSGEMSNSPKQAVKVKNPIPPTCRPTRRPTRRSTHNRHTTDASANTLPTRWSTHYRRVGRHTTDTYFDTLPK